MQSRLLLIVVLVLGVLASSAFAVETHQVMNMTSDTTYMNEFGQFVPGIRCGTVDMGPPELARAPLDLDAWMKEHGFGVDKAFCTIPVAFHVLMYYSNKTGGYIGVVTDQQIYDQIDVLNAAYGPSNFQFSLASIDRTDNKSWATMRPGSKAEQDCKAALAIDPTHTLNVYTAYPTGGLLGWSYFPWSFAEDNFMHGSVIHFGSLPGGYADPYNEGDTATHEIGHYVGLYHTFQGGCTEPNDYCDDTPQEAQATFRCPIGQDSCPDDPGLDPIFNFMDYTDDYCMIEFTPDQAARMAWAITEYKPGLLAAKVLDRAPTSTVALTSLKGVYPNPFNPKTEVAFFVGQEMPVVVSVYDLAGRRVQTLVDRTLDRGEYTFSFDGNGLPSSVYFLRMDAGDQHFTQKMVLLK